MFDDWVCFLHIHISLLWCELIFQCILYLVRDRFNFNNIYIIVCCATIIFIVCSGTVLSLNHFIL